MATPLPAPPGPEIDWLRAEVSRYFPVYEVRITPVSLVLLVHADATTLEERFDGLRRDLWPKFYVPQLRYVQGEYTLEIVRRTVRRSSGFWVNLALLAATVVSTAFAGSFLWLSYVGSATLVPADFLWGGLYFAAPLLAILGLHELAHYVVARHHHVEASLPFFLPVPPPYLIFGTFGAFISLREPIPSRKVLFDIGASGPLAGFLVAIPVTIAGMFLSLHAPVLPLTNCGPTILGVNYGNLLVGLPLAWQLLALFVPNAAAIVSLHPLALAGWVGLLVTSINLLPAGQLDGGHVFRALFGDRSRYVSYAAVIFLALIGFVTLYLGWLLFAVLIILLGVRHPPPLNDVSPLGGRRALVGALVVAVLVGGFVLVPISTPGDSFSLEKLTASHVSGTGFGVASVINVTVANHDSVVHGYGVAANVTQVTLQNTSIGGPLSGPRLAAFLANSTWTIVLPDGTIVTEKGVGKWALPSNEFLTLAAQHNGTLRITYTNTQTATVDVSFTASQFCNASGGGPTKPQTVSVY
ncbi:MAG: site-2 protease family protein [Thermoplasmata archaeon]|nr:site-2 protease family protein [Thermoplasmata archaeon]